MNRQTRFHIGSWLVAIIAFLVLQYVFATNQRVATIPYSQFERLLHKRQVSEISVCDHYIEGKLKKALPNGKRQFVTDRVSPQFASQLQKYGVTYTGRTCAG